MQQEERVGQEDNYLLVQAVQALNVHHTVLSALKWTHRGICEPAPSWTCSACTCTCMYTSFAYHLYHLCTIKHSSSTAPCKKIYYSCLLVYGSSFSRMRPVQVKRPPKKGVSLSTTNLRTYFQDSLIPLEGFGKGTLAGSCNKLRCRRGPIS